MRRPTAQAYVLPQTCRERSGGIQQEQCMHFSGKKEKVIQFSKYREVLRLSKEGMDEIEIAKNLNMGKGESN